MFDPIFDVLTWLLAKFYDLVPSYGFAIIALTALVLGVLSPLTYRSTKSMVQMRQLQPQLKRLQKKYKGDRETLNQETMKLYQEHKVSPLSGCLPILVQSPVFFIMFRVIRGITRRSSDTGYPAGAAFNLPDGATAPATIRNNFNPEYLNPDTSIYQALVRDNEMLWLGLDLSRSPWEVIRDSLGSAIPYLLMVALVAFLGWYQQRQIHNRMTTAISPQQEMIMKIIPWMLPIFSFTMPAGLVLYFIVSALLRILQQAYLTKSVYQNEELNKEIDFGNDDDDFDDDDDDDDDEPSNPLEALFGGAKNNAAADAKPSNRHGSKRPTSRPANAKRSKPTPSKQSKSGSGSKKDSAESNGAGKLSGRGRKKASPPSKSNETPAKPVSRRVTPKGDSSPKNQRGKK